MRGSCYLSTFEHFAERRAPHGSTVVAKDAIATRVRSAFSGFYLGRVSIANSKSTAEDGLDGPQRLTRDSKRSGPPRNKGHH